MSTIAARLNSLGITLPSPASPVANYVPTVMTGSLLFVSGQICYGPDGKLAPAHIGKLGGTVSAEEGKRAARFAGLNVIAQVQKAVDDLDRVVRCVRLGGFINAMPDYAPLPAIMNGASDLMVEVFGDAGRHARTTIGVAELPMDAAVEVEAIFEIR